MHRDLQTEGGSGGPAVLEATERLHYYDAADRLVAVDARLGTAPGSGNYLHFLLTFDTYRYDALGRRVWVRSERRCAETSPGVVHPGADFYADCRLGFVHRTVWDGVRELAEVRMPDVSAHWERDSVPAGVELGQVSNGTVRATRDLEAHAGRVSYVYGGVLDQPLVVLRQDYGDRRVSATSAPLPYRRFAPFALYPQWDVRGEPPIGTAADGGLSRCEVVSGAPRCTYALAWTQVWSPHGKPVDDGQRGWVGTLLQDKPEPNGLLYRRARYLNPATGRFTQPDPIGLAGGLNSYGFANGDPVNYSDPFGLCPQWLMGRPCSTGVAIGVGFIPVVGDAIDIIGAVRGKDLLTGEHIGPVGVGATIAGTILGSGKLARMGAEAAEAGTRRIFSARVLERMTEGPLHNFPQSVGDEVLAHGTRTVKSSRYAEYTMRGTVNGKSGTYEIGVRPSASGRNETITHWFFRPDKK